MTIFALTWAHSFALSSGVLGLLVAIIGAFKPSDALFKAGILYAVLGAFLLSALTFFRL